MDKNGHNYANRGHNVNIPDIKDAGAADFGGTFQRPVWLAVSKFHRVEREKKSKTA